MLHKKGRRSADRRNCPRSTPRRRALPLVGARGVGALTGAHAYRRSAAALVAANERRHSTPGRASWDLAKDGCYPSPPVPVQRASRKPVIMPAGRLPRAARERFARPPAGTALTPPSGSHPEWNDGGGATARYFMSGTIRSSRCRLIAPRCLLNLFCSASRAIE